MIPPSLADRLVALIEQWRQRAREHRESRQALPHNNLRWVFEGRSAEAELCADELDALLATGVPPSQVWQPIETAPKDLEVLVWTLGACEPEWLHNIAKYSTQDSAWTSIDGFPTSPTHWRPLPPAPQEPT
jgi:hypothetical protein